MVLTEHYRCSFVGCGRSFKRQEHLTRHERSHDPAYIFVCEVCQKEFNRKDSLHRHLQLHSDVLTVALPKKTRRACIACRRGKNKCDGEARCSNCIRRDIECRYHRDDGDDDVRMGGTSEEVTQHSESQTVVSTEDDSRTGHSPVPQIFAPSEYSLESEHSTNSPDIVPDKNHPRVYENTNLLAQHANIPRIPKPFGETKIINWMTAEVRRDPVNLANANKVVTEMDEENRLKYELYLEAFFRLFHHRWPLIHRPTYKETDGDSSLLSSIRMIGAWLVGTTESRKFALATHETCLEEFIPKLHQITCQDKFQLSLSSGMCQSALLNIIFSLYCGNDKVISRSVILLNTLVAALREVGFFQEDTAWHDEKPRLFLPMKMAFLGQRQRLATYLFKIDTYLSISRNQPPSLSSEELHFTLTTTFALYNSNGLHIWEERQLSEPSYRNQTTIFNMITNNFTWLDESTSQPMLIEDIQTCLCAAWASIWRISKSQRLLKLSALNMNPEKVALKRRLDAMQSRLQRIADQIWGIANFGREPYLPSKYYFGSEDSSQSKSNDIVSARIQGLLVDALMLYHLLSLHLSSNIPILVRLAKDQHLTPVEEVSEIQGQARVERLNLTKKWVASSDARRALCHAVDILLANRSVREKVDLDTNVNRKSAQQDPIANVAQAFAALVIWAYSVYSDCACEICLPNPLIPVVELSRWSNFGFEVYKNEKDAWIDTASDLRPQIQGIQICRCNASYLTETYKSYLPADWEVANMTLDGPTSCPSNEAS